MSEKAKSAVSKTMTRVGSGTVAGRRLPFANKNNLSKDEEEIQPSSKVATKTKKKVTTKDHHGQRRQTFGAPLDFVMHRQKRSNPELGIPLVVDQCVRSCTKNGIDAPNLFSAQSRRSPGVLKLVRRADHDPRFDLVSDPPDPQDVVGLLLLFLRLLPEPLLTFDLFDNWISCAAITDRPLRRAKCLDLLRLLPKTNLRTLHAICEFALRIIHNSHVNHTTSAILSSVLAPLLLWPPESMDCIEYMMLSAPFKGLVEQMISEVEEMSGSLVLGKDAEDVILEAKLFGHEKSVQGVVAIPQLQEVWTVCSDGILVVWDVEARRQVHQINTGLGRVSQLTTITQGTVVAACSAWGVRTYNAASRSLLQELQGFAICVVEVANALWVGGEHEIAVWESQQVDMAEDDSTGDFLEDDYPATPRTKMEMKKQRLAMKRVESLKVQQSELVISMCVVEDRREVWAALTNSAIRVYHMDSRILVAKADDGHTKQVNVLVHVNDEVWSAGSDYNVIVWSAKTHSVLRKLENGHSNPVFALGLAPPFAWSGARDPSALIIWDLENYSVKARVENYFSDMVSSIAYIENTATDSAEVWVASLDKSVAVFRQIKRLHALE